jgi:hypothetical protein
MTHEALQADYLVVGSGAMGLAFTDELLKQRPGDSVVLVDQRAKPGGHWNDAYRFVSLHQPAAFYGVNSLSLGSGGAALATGSEVLTYYERVLTRLLASGRVQYLPMCSYQGEGRVESLIAPGKGYSVEARKKTVDSTYMKVEVPATTPPRYQVAEGVSLVPPNELPRLSGAHSSYVVIGAGKTGMDAVLFLLGQAVDPSAITWIMSNDAWLLDRDTLTPGRTLGWFVDQLELIQNSQTLEEVFLETEKAQSFMRLDPSVWPTKFRCATVNREELAALRGVENVVRKGRVKRIEPSIIVLEQGEIATSDDALHVDCTADGLAKRPARPIFAGDTITLQSVFMCQQVFSAALIAYVETRYQDDARKNELCQVVPHPEFNLDYLAAMATSNMNFDRWGRELGGWLKRSRLSLAHHEPFLRLLVNTWRAKKVGRPAVERMHQILSAEVAKMKEQVSVDAAE